MKCNCFLLIQAFSLCFGSLWAQQEEYRFAVFFKDKGGNEAKYSLESPQQFLSTRALERRERQQIALDASDLPVHEGYRNAVLSLEGNVHEVAASKWMNFQMVSTADSSLSTTLSSLDFVEKVVCVYSGSAIWEPGNKTEYLSPKEGTADTMTQKLRAMGDAFYGESDRQQRMLGMDFVHQLGGWGQNLVVAVMDGGFRNYDKISSFQPLLSQERLLGTWDFVAGHASVSEDASHGMQVLSCMASWAPGEMVGTAPGAHYLLFRTEHTAAETPMEPYLWICAAELADSLGADVLNTSLGYTTFDAPFESYSYADLDGETILVSRAAQMAAQKGMLVFNSAGNSGNSSWKYIGAPADAKDIIAVGAVDANREKAGFSSFGPSADDRVKPELAAMGRKTVLYGAGDALTNSNGTSFSSPVLAGGGAAFWSLHPTESASTIRTVMMESGHLFAAPGPDLGYGIPHFGNAHARLSRPELLLAETFMAAPNPVEKSEMLTFFFHAADTGLYQLQFFMVNGAEAFSTEIGVSDKGPVAYPLSLAGIGLNAGVYSVRLSLNGISKETRLVLN